MREGATERESKGVPNSKIKLVSIKLSQQFAYRISVLNSFCCSSGAVTGKSRADRGRRERRMFAIEWPASSVLVCTFSARGGRFSIDRRFRVRGGTF